jgi:hypothetical protein
MKQTKKGNQWYFGMKAHIGVDAASGCVHSAEMTSANVHDSVVTDALLHGEEEIAFGDSAYASNERSLEADRAEGDVIWGTPFKRRTGQALTDEQRRINRLTSGFRSKVEPSSVWSSASSATPRPATAGCTKTASRFSANSPWPISTSCASNWREPQDHCAHRTENGPGNSQILAKINRKSVILAKSTRHKERVEAKHTVDAALRPIFLPAQSFLR